MFFLMQIIFTVLLSNMAAVQNLYNNISYYYDCFSDSLWQVIWFRRSALQIRDGAKKKN